MFPPSGAVRDKNTLWAWAVIFVTSAHAQPDVRNFLTSGNGCFQNPSFPDHMTKKRRAVGTRMASLLLSMIKIELYQISLSLGRGRSGYEIMPTTIHLLASG